MRETATTAGIDPAVLVREAEALGADIRRLAPALADQLSEARGAGWWDGVEHVSLIGAGDSHHAACAAMSAFETFAAVPCDAVDAFRFVEYGSLPRPRRGGRALVVVASASGRTPSAVAAIEAARERGASTIALTGDAASPAAAAADARLAVELTDRERSPGVRTYGASLLGMLLLAVELGLARGAMSDDEARAARNQVERAADVVEADALELPERCRAVAEAVVEAGCALVLGSGPHLGTARFAAAKLVEAAGVFAVAQDLEGWWHVERRIRTPAPTLIVLAPEGRSRARAEDVVAAGCALGRTVVVVGGASDRIAGLPGASLVPVRAPLREELSPLAYPAVAACIASLTAELLGRRGFEDDPVGFPHTLDGFRERAAPAETAAGPGTLARVADVVRRHAQDGADALAPDDDLASLGLDSLGLVALMVDLETTLGVSFPPDALEPSTFRSVRTITEALGASTPSSVEGSQGSRRRQTPVDARLTWE